ncbi:MAG: class II aldolase/adducin family protein [Bacteroidetes bacterium]|nr:class II aldolase/adducin family protein [Bacteroidota bacterium]
MTTSNETGSIKFQCNWIQTDPLKEEVITEINHWRNILFNNKLIGVYPNGIGYGNISIRLTDKEFLISGTSTGHLENLSTNHYSTVIDYNFSKNELTCKGQIKASAESLTHAAVYEMDLRTQAIIHIHNKQMWDKLLNQIPTTSSNVEYGTPQMALEIKRLFNTTDLLEKKVLVMGGHEEGIISFGENLKEAGDLILRYL